MAFDLFAGNIWRGLSTDAKPSATTYAGHLLVENDSGKYFHATGGAWVRLDALGTDTTVAGHAAETGPGATHTHTGDTNTPTTDQKAALAGTSGVPSGTNKYVTDADARNTNARTPSSTLTHGDAAHNALTYEASGAVATHAAAGDPHTGYRLESADHTHATTGLQGGTVAHTALTSIGTNTHAQVDTFVASKAAASGLASLDANSKLVQARARADDGMLYTVLANDTLAQAYATNSATKLTVTAARTLTTTVPPANCRAATIILTSGTTSWTITFGAGFKPTATLATGIVSARVFVIEWLSDGTNLYESSRTIAMVA